MAGIPSTVTLGWLFAGVGGLVAWICVTRMISLRGRAFGRRRKISEWVVLSLATLIAVVAAVSSGANVAILHHVRALTPGRMYLVRGYRMHMDCIGSGSPTLVLDAALGNDSLIWGGVQPALAKSTRVCAYDRAGWGLSQAVPGPQDANHIADELHGLLDAAGIHDPVVLMGHSIAGIYIRAYASRYPAQSAGLIFVDATTPLQDEDPVVGAKMPHGSPPLMRLFLVKAVMALGVPRWMGACSRHLPGFSAEAQKLQDADFCDPRVDAGVGEMLHFHQSGEQTVHDGPYGDLPVLVLSSDPAKQMADQLSRVEVDAWERMQENLKQLSTHSRRIIAKGSGHNIQLDRPDLIEREVPLFIEQIRGTQPPPISYGTTTTE
jgi:pimeloyl-ACP methyl ester carboxylesterase